MDVDQECYAAVLRNGYESSWSVLLAKRVIGDRA